MARVPLRPIGRPREQVVDDATFDTRQTKLAGLEERLHKARQEVHGGWGEKYVKRVHDKGKFTARERIERLKDPGTRIHEAIGRAHV